MKRVEFRLSMPRAGSWNGKWSGEGKNYSIVRRISEKRFKELFGDKNYRSWSHFWSDGWSATVSAHGLDKGERVKKSDGFYGYDWMISDIIANGEIRK